MQCPKCNSNKNVKKPKGPHTGLYCSDCGQWLTWVAKPKPKTEYRDNTTWQPPTSGWTKPIFGRRHTR